MIERMSDEAGCCFNVASLEKKEDVPGYALSGKLAAVGFLFMASELRKCRAEEWFRL
jgi:hypothetical protein